MAETGFDINMLSIAIPVQGMVASSWPLSLLFACAPFVADVVLRKSRATVGVCPDCFCAPVYKLTSTNQEIEFSWTLLYWVALLVCFFAGRATVARDAVVTGAPLIAPSVAAHTSVEGLARQQVALARARYGVNR